MMTNEPTEKLITPQVLPEEEKQRLDKWLSTHTPFSRSRLSSLIEQGCIYLNATPLLSQDKKVLAGEIYEIHVPPALDAIPVAQEIPLEVVYEDSDLLVINKQAGMVVHPAAGNYDGTLVNALLAHCKDSLSGIGGVIRPGIVHRLDKDTTGLLVVAKNDATHTHLSEQFSVHSLERCYLALVWGALTPSSGVIETQIGRSPVNRKKMSVLKTGGKRAETHYRQIKTFANQALSLVECSLKTGRTHQVRVHLTSLGHPLLGDTVYGSTPKKALKDKALKQACQCPRQALHSYKMSFVHPRTKETMRFEIDLPQDMQAIIDSLESI